MSYLRAGLSVGGGLGSFLVGLGLAFFFVCLSVCKGHDKLLPPAVREPGSETLTDPGT